MDIIVVGGVVIWENGFELDCIQNLRGILLYHDEKHSPFTRSISVKRRLEQSKDYWLTNSSDAFIRCNTVIVRHKAVGHLFTFSLNLNGGRDI